MICANNYQAAVGNTKGTYTEVSMTSDTDVADPDEFRNLVVKQANGTQIRLQDIARVELGSETYSALALYKGQPATYVAIELAPGANPLTVAGLVKGDLPEIESQLPSDLNVRLAYDASDFIEDSINEVIRTLIEAMGIVLVVVFLCLGSIRASIVPSVAVPLSLIGGAFLLVGFIASLIAGFTNYPMIETLHLALGGSKPSSEMPHPAIAAMVYFANSGHGLSVKEILITIFLLITAPISGYMLIKSAIHHKLKAKEGTKGLDNVEDD